MEKVLVVQLARMGDLLQSARLVQSLAVKNEVHVCVDASLLEFGRHLYPFAVFHGLQAHGGKMDEAWSRNRGAFSGLMENDFTRVFNLNFSEMNLALSRLFDPARMVGHWSENGQMRRDKWTEFAFRWTQDRRSAPLNLADFWAWLMPRPLLPDQVNPPVMPHGGGIGVVLAGRSARRSLPPETLAPIITAAFERESARHGRAAPIFLLGSDQEYPLARKVLRCLPGAVLRQVRDMTGKTSLRDVQEITASLDVLLTPDTGLMHLAARLGTPVEAFFLSSAWCFETGPYGRGHVIWQAMPTGRTGCLPCLETAECPLQVECGRPFSQPAFLEAMKGHAPSQPGIIRLVSGFDELGVTYEAAEKDPFLEKRRMLRAMLGEWLGQNMEMPFYGTRPDIGFYQERDWMLPER